MNMPNGPEEERPGDLESRWEALLHGRASEEETAAVQREVAESGRRAEFEAQAEVVAAVRGHAARRGAPAGLRARLHDITASAGGSSFRGRVWWAAAGALAASLVIAAVMSISQKQPEKALFAAVAQEARAEYQRAMLDPRPIQTGSTVLGKILGWFEPRVNFRPRVYFAGGGETVLEGGRVGYVAGAKVPGFLYRWRGKPLVLLILPAREYPGLPRKKWVALTAGGPTTSVWRRGDFIYAIVGNVPVEKMREISRAITPPNKKF